MLCANQSPSDVNKHGKCNREKYDAWCEETKTQTDKKSTKYKQPCVYCKPLIWSRCAFQLPEIKPKTQQEMTSTMVNGQPQCSSKNCIIKIFLMTQFLRNAWRLRIGHSQCHFRLGLRHHFRLLACWPAQSGLQ